MYPADIHTTTTMIKPDRYVNNNVSINDYIAISKYMVFGNNTAIMEYHF